MNICVGRRGGSAGKTGEEDARRQGSEERQRIPDFISRHPHSLQEARFLWKAELIHDDNLARTSARVSERQRVNGKTHAHHPDHTGRANFDPRLVGEACRAVLRNGNASDSGETPDDEPFDDDDWEAGGQGIERRYDTRPAGRPAEPWWRTQISQQMDHARLEATERHRRQRIATVLADNEQHRRMAEQAAYGMEDGQERVRRREFAKIVLDEEQHTRVREDRLAAERDNADRNRRRRYAIKALRQEEARITTVRVQRKRMIYIE